MKKEKQNFLLSQCDFVTSTPHLMSVTSVVIGLRELGEAYPYPAGAPAAHRAPLHPGQAGRLRGNRAAHTQLPGAGILLRLHEAGQGFTSCRHRAFIWTIIIF